MRQNDDDPRIVNAVDLLLPGVGEVCGGAEREDDPVRLRERLETSPAAQQLHAAGGSIEDYEWYLELREHDSIPLCRIWDGFRAIGSVHHWKRELPGLYRVPTQ